MKIKLRLREKHYHVINQLVSNDDVIQWKHRFVTNINKAEFLENEKRAVIVGRGTLINMRHSSDLRHFLSSEYI